MIYLWAQQVGLITRTSSLCWWHTTLLWLHLQTDEAKLYLLFQRFILRTLRFTSTPVILWSNGLFHVETIHVLTCDFWGCFTLTGTLYKRKETKNQHQRPEITSVGENLEKNYSQAPSSSWTTVSLFSTVSKSTFMATMITASFVSFLLVLTRTRPWYSSVIMSAERLLHSDMQT